MGEIKARSMYDEYAPDGYDQYSEIRVNNLISLFYGSVIEDLSGDKDDTEPAYSNADIVKIMRRNAYDMATMLNTANACMNTGIAVNVLARRVMKPWCAAPDSMPVMAGCLFEDCATCNYNKKLEGNKNE